MQVEAEDYGLMRAWFARMAGELLPNSGADDPVAALDAIAVRAPAKARMGLSMAIGDIVEMTDSCSSDRLVVLDAIMALEGLPTLTEVRSKFSKFITKAVGRGRIKGEAEYYAVRNAVELETGRQQEKLWPLLADYEAHSRP